MGDDLQRVIGELVAKVASLERRVAENESWVKKGVMALLSALAALAYAYLKSKGVF